MKTETHRNLVHRTVSSVKKSSVINTPSERVAPKVNPNTGLTQQEAKEILFSLMFPSMMMVLAFSMSRVALPIIREDFGIQADMTAWVATIFTLPFMMLMPVYGRLSDGLGKRRLILAGVVIFSIGTAVTLMSTNLAWLMAGRAIQGIGASGLMPLGMAFISQIFPAKERGKALGNWSMVGPTTGFVSPLIAGFLIDHWGWRAAYAPPLFVGIIAFLVVWKKVPAGLSIIKPKFFRTFDWTGVALLTGAMTSLLFFLSSRPITGIAPLHDWRLLASTLFLMGGFLWWEKRRPAPFVDLNIFKNKMFSLSSFCGGMRMVAMSSIGFLVPLYLVDIHQVSAAYIGGLLMISPGTMALLTRFGGQLADRFGSRWPAVAGISLQASALVIFSLFTENTSLWLIAGTLSYYGCGAGLVLAALHRSAMGNLAEEQMGAAAGLYSMMRFAGAVIGTALCGVMLQTFFDLQLPTIEAYQNVFLIFGGISGVGAVAALWLREPEKTEG